MEITQRQAQILAAIVKEYSQKGEPVGSEELTDKYHFELSPATIRNEMQALEKAGFLVQPHTSAGRMPTDQGYRYFVNKLMGHLQLKASEQERLRVELRRLQKQYLELGRSITKLLADQAQGAAFALLPQNVSTSGFSQIIDEDTTSEEVKELANFFEELEDHGKALIKMDIKEVEAFIGREAPSPLASDFSLVVSRVDMPGGQKGLIGIVGPKRMKYARNISLLEYVSKLIAGGLGAVVIFNF
ncbi:MAG: hypothetical protein U1C57_02860 [Candidatus Doudnabacteria bacterium]|nr:hypothetical protein [bacterium]MDZ4244023.1 hypothetical protein [Candidatus Doudnabacteria bacterium]